MLSVPTSHFYEMSDFSFLMNTNIQITYSHVFKEPIIQNDSECPALPSHRPFFLIFHKEIFKSIAIYNSPVYYLDLFIGSHKDVYLT